VSESSSFDWVAEAIAKANIKAKFCVAGCLPSVDPGLEVDGLGALRFPMKPGAAKKLIEACQVAPYGQGTQTLVDTKVRKTFELDPQRFRLSEAWNAAVANVLESVAQRLGLPTDRLESKLYKLLVYDKGGFFLPHRDSEKQDRMIASLIVVLPSKFEGGELIVRHTAAKVTLDFKEAAVGKTPCFAAFYADCEHEVKRVNRGVRIALAYNLVLKPARNQPSTAAGPADPLDELTESLQSWVARQPGQPLVFALEHHYTQRGLSLDLLKGSDRILADMVVAAAEKTDCLVHLAQVQRHLQQWADDGSFGRGYRNRNDRTPRRKSEIVIGETFEDDLHGTQWTDLQENKQPWGDIPLAHGSIVSSTALDDWKPTSQEFEGYTGNEGNTLDRWYHRSALVVWHRDHHFDVVAHSDALNCNPLFYSMAAKLAETPKRRFEDARRDCIRFARAIIGRWPRTYLRFGDEWTKGKSPLDDFPKHLLLLHDRDTVACFLSQMAKQDPTLTLKSFVVTVCREFGGQAFAGELKQLLLGPHDEREGQEIPYRDIEWLSAFCCDTRTAPDPSQLAAELCAIVVDRFCKTETSRSGYDSYLRDRGPSVPEKSLPLLCKALLASGQEEGLARVLHFIQQSPDTFRFEECQVPALITLMPWSKKELGRIHPQLAAWLAAVRKALETAAAQPPDPPSDWTRPANVKCNCQYCAQLKNFLADPDKQVGRIRAREDVRRHLMFTLEKHKCDVKYELESVGSPYSLVLTKTYGSFERAVKRYNSDCRLLSDLPPASLMES